MSALRKARLAEMRAGEAPTEVEGSSVDVQFNPTTLRVQISNQTAGGAQAGAQARQRPGTGEMQVSFDLVFDTADEGNAGQGVNVLERTKAVERFVRPRGNRSRQEAPPRVLFEWGSFQVQGVMESANIDLDFFDAAGVPLRAKVAVVIKGQDPRWTYQAAAPASGPQGRGAGPGAGAAGRGSPALPPGAPGTSGSPAAVDRIVQALPGESLAQLASRSGLAPDAWRALAAGVTDPLKLALGQEVALPQGPPTGVAGGNRAASQDRGATGDALPLFAAAAPVSGASVAPRAPSAPASSAAAAAADPVLAGQALASQGGARSAIQRARGQAHATDAARSLAAFGQSRASPSALEDRPWGAGVPLRPRRGAAARTTPIASTAAPQVAGRIVCACGGRCPRCSGR